MFWRRGGDTGRAESAGSDIAPQAYEQVGLMGLKAKADVAAWAPPPGAFLGGVGLFLSSTVLYSLYSLLWEGPTDHIAILSSS